MLGYYNTMKSKGFSYKTTASVRKFECPVCGFEFSLVYARTFACQGCSEASKGCPKVRCNKCDHEFYIKDVTDAKGKKNERIMADHICDIVNNRHEDMGLSSYNR
jgi:hypothetical protein